jgi:hypothetical protein
MSTRRKNRFSKKKYLQKKKKMDDDYKLTLSEEQFFDVLRMRSIELAAASKRVEDFARRLWTSTAFQEDDKLSKLVGVRIIAKLSMWLFNAINKRLVLQPKTEKVGWSLLKLSKRLKLKSKTLKKRAENALTRAHYLEETTRFQPWIGQALLGPYERALKKNHYEEIAHNKAAALKLFEDSNDCEKKSEETDGASKTFLAHLNVTFFIYNNYRLKLQAARHKETLLQRMDMNELKEGLFGMKNKVVLLPEDQMETLQNSINNNKHNNYYDNNEVNNNNNNGVHKTGDKNNDMNNVDAFTNTKSKPTSATSTRSGGAVMSKTKTQKTKILENSLDAFVDDVLRFEKNELLKLATLQNKKHSVQSNNLQKTDAHINSNNNNNKNKNNSNNIVSKTETKDLVKVSKNGSKKFGFDFFDDNIETDENNSVLIDVYKNTKNTENNAVKLDFNDESDGSLNLKNIFKNFDENNFENFYDDDDNVLNKKKSKKNKNLKSTFIGIENNNIKKETISKFNSNNNIDKNKVRIVNNNKSNDNNKNLKNNKNRNLSNANADDSGNDEADLKNVFDEKNLVSAMENKLKIINKKKIMASKSLDAKNFKNFKKFQKIENLNKNDKNNYVESSDDEDESTMSTSQQNKSKLSKNSRLSKSSSNF